MRQTTSEIRRIFLDYFREQGHLVLPSSSLVPTSDPTLMFTNAGMVPFKDVFTGRTQRPAPRAATAQKCIRISGKHNDLENVGRTSRHHTFFEMLGNFSFGDYFKAQACRFGYELLTKGYGLDPARLWITVFEGDKNAPADVEAEAIWRDEVGVPPERITRCSAKDNFWAMGDTGPCGPCSEIHFDRGPAFGAADIHNGERFFELWNLVFMQYFVEEPGGPFKALPKPCIDTGAGLERIASVLQGVDTNYGIDVLAPLVTLAGKLAGKTLGQDAEHDVSMRVIADHARMAAFLIAEGIFPEKTGREYVLRRVMRRAIRHAHRLGIEDLFFHIVTDEVVRLMGADYPELVDRRGLIADVCRQEEERFRATLGRGLSLLGENKDWYTDPQGKRVLQGAIAFDLTATYGFPKDLIEVIGEEDGFIIDEEGYRKAEESHKLASGAGKIGEHAVARHHLDWKRDCGQAVFVGYEQLTASAAVLALCVGGAPAEQAAEGDKVEVVLDRTPFYGESGGQVGDQGMLRSAGCEVRIDDTIKPVAGLFVHVGEVTHGKLAVGQTLEAAVDGARRAAIRRHHTATHLLHMALRQVLGPKATQKGSYVTPAGLRFDYAHSEPMTAAQLAKVEELVCEKICENHVVTTEEIPFATARERGAMALFGEAYGDVVRLVSVSESSKELCGGTHASRSGDIGAFLITAETGIAAGVRRIEATAGLAALETAQTERELLEDSAALLKVGARDLEGRIKGLIARERELGKEVEQLKRRLATGGTDLMERVRDVEGIKVLGAALEIGDPGALRDTADTLRQKLGSGVVCLVGNNKGKAAILVAVTKDLSDRLPAGALVGEVAKVVGGRGGGRPDLAQAGGPDVSKLDSAVEEIFAAVARARRSGQ